MSPSFPVGLASDPTDANSLPSVDERGQQRRALSVVRQAGDDPEGVGMDLQQLRGHRVDRGQRLEQLVVGPVVTGRPQARAAELTGSRQRQQAGRAQLGERLRGELGALVELTGARADPVGEPRDRLQPGDRLSRRV